MKDLLIFLFTNLVVIAGWFVVFRQAIHLRRRDDVRKTVDLIGATVDEVYDICREYYSQRTDGHINYLSTNIKAKFVLISHYLILVSGSDIVKNVSPALRAFKIHATGGYFETTDYHKQEDVPNWKTELAASAHELKFRVEKGYFDWSKSKSGIWATLLPSA